MAKKLQLIADNLNKYNVRNSEELIPELSNFMLEIDHKLCSLDYVSMFTNIDVDKTFSIILKFYHVISATTSVPAEIFISVLKFFIIDATYFVFNGQIFKQIKGLAMGNKLAQVLAEICTNYVLIDYLKGFGADEISFFYKYVDDIFTSIHVDHIAAVKENISTAANMELTVTDENENLDVEFLDCVFRRNQDLSISNRWLKKGYNSLSILNYHSYHPINMKVNVVREIIRHAFAVTSSEFMKETKELLITILHNSSYPSRFIANQLSAISSASTNRVQSKVNRPSVRYVSCPYFELMMENIQSIATENCLNIKLAPKPSSNNRKVLFSRIKDARNQSSIKNAVFKVKCKNCDFVHISTTKHFDVRRTVQFLINDKHSPCYQHLVEFPHHSINENAAIIKTFYNKYDVEHSKYLLKNIKEIKYERKF